MTQVDPFINKRLEIATSISNFSFGSLEDLILLQAAKEFETELKKDPEALEESKTAVNEMVEQENEDAKSTQVTL